MYTQCPECGTVFRVTATVLRAARGQVRCGVCNTTFDSLEYLTEELATEPAPSPSAPFAYEEPPPPEPASLVDADEALADLERISAELAEPDPAGTPTNQQPLEAPGLDDSIEVEIMDPALAEEIVVGSESDAPTAESGSAAAIEVEDSEDAALEFNLPEDQWSRVFVQDSSPTIPPLNPALQQARDAALAQEPFVAPQLDDSIEVEILEPSADQDHPPVEAIELASSTEELSLENEDPLARTDRYPALQLHQERGPERRRGEPESIVPLDLGAEPLARGEPLVARAIAADAADANSWASLADDTSAAPVAVEPVAPDSLAPAAPRQLGILAQAPTTTIRATPLASAVADDLDDEAPATPWWHKVGAALLLALLFVVLAAQAVHYFREELAANPLFRQPLTQLYADLGVTLESPGDLGAYELRQWGAAAEASGGVLRVRASILNRADRAQPYPLLRVTLEDRFGGRLGQREFAPPEYLPGRKPPTGLLAARGRADADLAIADPGAEAVGFALDVCLRRHGALVCASEQSRARP